MASGFSRSFMNETTSEKSLYEYTGKIGENISSTINSESRAGLRMTVGCTYFSCTLTFPPAMTSPLEVLMSLSARLVCSNEINLPVLCYLISSPANESIFCLSLEINLSSYDS